MISFTVPIKSLRLVTLRYAEALSILKICNQPERPKKRGGSATRQKRFELLLLGAPGRRVSVQLLQQRMSRGSPECGAPAGGC